MSKRPDMADQEKAFEVHQGLERRSFLKMAAGAAISAGTTSTVARFASYDRGAVYHLAR